MEFAPSSPPSKEEGWRLLDLEAWLKSRNPKLYEWLFAPSLMPYVETPPAP